MEKISWVNTKNLNIQKINIKINDCIETKHFTNNGKNVVQLNKKIHKIFNIDDTKSVLLTCNGAMGINALIGGLNIYYNKQLKWAVQSFTFPCSCQGPLKNSLILDIDENMGPNIDKLYEHINDYDGILITNCFGCSTNIELYENFCKNNNKLLLFDNAAASYTIYKNKNHLNYGNGCMVSLHHTKPIGFGEGGFIIFDNKYLESMEKSICFGFSPNDRLLFDKNASNYKMSEISAIFIDDYLNNFEKIYEHHKKIISYFIEKIREKNLENKISLYKSFSNYKDSLLATIPIIFDKEVNIDKFTENNIEAKKYYYPLDHNCKLSVDIFNKIVCLPLNCDINYNVIDKYINIILELNNY
jgi:dTDP-4-amino-4,6-dideoxygalactose transaminase